MLTGSGKPSACCLDPERQAQRLERRTDFCPQFDLEVLILPDGDELGGTTPLLLRLHLFPHQEPKLMQLPALYLPLWSTVVQEQK